MRHINSGIEGLYVCSSTNPQKVTIVNGSTASVSFVNKLNTGRLALTKKTDDGSNLSGWRFGIYSDSGCTALISGPHTTDANGTISVDGITPGTYYVKEIGHTDSSINEKYVCSGTNPEKVTIAGGAAASVTFINKIKTGNFSLTKTASDGLNLAGWEFGIYSDSGCTTLVSGPHTTDSKGAISVTGLEIGIYYVKELGHRDDDVEAMYSCASDNPQKVTITYGTTASVSFHNSLETGSVKLIKQTNTGENLSGWQIGIYTDVACTKPIEGSPFTTGTDGTIVIDGLTLQKLYAKEIAVDDPYWVCDSSVKAITVKANATVSVTFSNTHNGDLRVKKNAIDGSPEGWNFHILDANRELVETITTGEDGYAASGKLEPGTYYVVEIHDRDERGCAGIMTPEQQKIVEANMGLVGKVIKEKVRRLGQPDTPSYEDLFQAGCIGLCEAAITDKGGCFSTYAYRLIWNEICDELIRNTKLVLNEQSTDTVDVLSEAASAHPDPLTIFDLRHTIGQAKAKAQGGTARGIQCLELTVQGYTSKEIGAIVGADPGTVRMWMTRARKYLKSLPELRAFGYPEAV